MKSRAYSGIRVCSQVVSTISIVLNVLGMVYFFANQSIYAVENITGPKPLLCFYDTSQYLCALNILFGLLANCSITSGIKLYMRAYSRLAYTQIGCSLSSIIYFYVFYKPTLLQSVAVDIQKNPQYISSLELPVTNSYPRAFQEEEAAIRMFCILQAISVAFSYLLVKFFRFAISVDLEVAEKEKPQIQQAHIGLTNEALERREVVTLKSTAA